MTQNQSRPLFIQHHHTQDAEQYLQPPPIDFCDSARYADLLDINFGIDSNSLNSFQHDNSLSASPVSTQSLLSQYSPLSAFEGLPTPLLAEPSLFPSPRQSGQAAPYSSTDFLLKPNAMQSEWARNGRMTPGELYRLHIRHSSQSSMGSNRPASPFPQVSQVAMNASNGDLFHGSGSADDVNHYQLAPKSFSGVTYDRFYAPPPSGSADTTGVPGYSYQSTAPGRMDNSNFLLPEHPAGAPRSQPPSATSSIAPDSPATPAGGELDGDRSGGTVHPPVPKLERTTTDAYADELYNENFAAMSQSSAQTSISPTSDLFSQRLQAANNQRFSAATNSPVSSISRDRSPFRTGSPMAAIPVSDYRSAMGLHTRFGTAQQSRDQSRAMHNAQAVRQQIGMATPQTISPKDAMLEYRDTEGDNNFPLFPQRNTTGFDANAINKAAAAHSQQLFGSMSMDPVNDYLITSVPTPQFPFTNQPQSTMHSTGNPSRATTVDTGASEHGVAPQRPADTRADGGTYTCTYHGCTQRFKTPAILQKHKREGHRQAHGLSGSGTALGLVDTQAGPHKCDRINPSTGKPCNTVFSRPYDLTRHEHTIHNAEKQKVRCHICSDEKTFSRADALTRHYRVTHGDVEIPGKHRKRGGQA